MRSVVGAIMFLGACVLIGAGLIADGITRSGGSYGQGGYAMGGLVGIVSLVVMVSGTGQQIVISQPPTASEDDD